MPKRRRISSSTQEETPSANAPTNNNNNSTLLPSWIPLLIPSILVSEEDFGPTDLYGLFWDPGAINIGLVVINMRTGVIINAAIIHLYPSLLELPRTNPRGATTARHMQALLKASTFTGNHNALFDPNNPRLACVGIEDQTVMDLRWSPVRTPTLACEASLHNYYAPKNVVINCMEYKSYFKVLNDNKSSKAKMTKVARPWFSKDLLSYIDSTVKPSEVPHIMDAAGMARYHWENTRWCAQNTNGVVVVV